MQKAYFNPTSDQTCEIVGEGDYNFTKILAHTRQIAIAGSVEDACNQRFQAFQRLAALIPEDEEINLEWSHANTRSALELIYASAVDHFLINDFEMSAAMLEMLLELDPEDHLEASILLAFNYLALNETEALEDIADDIPEGAARQIVLLWAAYRRDGELPKVDLQYFKSRFAPYFLEFTADEHPADDVYLCDIEGEHPSKEALARELWLQTENLWCIYPDFINALRAAQ